MIETWLLVFLILFIRNKFIQNLEKNNIHIYQQYDLKKVFTHWTIIAPLIMLLLYIIFEIMIFNGYNPIEQYGNLYKGLTLFTYFGLVCRYELYNSMFEKYKDKGFKAFITSSFMLAMVCLVIGYLLNYIAIQANGGHMPVFPYNTYFSGYTDIHDFTQDSFYILGDYQSKAIPLCDTIDIFYSNLSIGDLFVRVYVFIILFWSVKLSNKKQK